MASNNIKTKTDNSFFNRLESYLNKKQLLYIFIIIGINILFSFLMFDAKISIGGDDSGYIERANQLLKHNQFPFYQGPLYPLILAIPIAIFGINLWVVKFTSLIFSALSIWFLYQAFRNRIPYMVLFVSLIFVAMNANIQFYSSQTYTEAFYMFLQALGFVFAFKLIDKVLDGGDFKNTWKLFLLNGAWVIILSLCKPVAIIMIAPFLGYFLLKKRWMALVYMFASLIVARGAYEVIIRATYGAPESGQLKVILMKDQYKPEQGMEDFNGLLVRAQNNLGLYLSYHFYHIMHLTGNTMEKYYEKNQGKNNMKLAWFTLSVFLLITLLNWKKNQAVFFACLVFLSFLGATFFGIQANNMQERLILPAVPLMVLALMAALYQLAASASVIQIYYSGLIGIIIFANLFVTAKQSGKNIPVLKQQLAGNKLAGFTPDWANYLKMSEYCADSLPADAKILTRKGNMSYIYTNGCEKFVTSYTAPQISADSMLTWLKNQKITHINVASLRTNPEINDGRIYTTMHFIIKPIDSTYPGRKLELIKTIGTEESASLYKVHYDR